MVAVELVYYIFVLGHLRCIVGEIEIAYVL